MRAGSKSQRMLRLFCCGWTHVYIDVMASGRAARMSLHVRAGLLTEPRGPLPLAVPTAASAARSELLTARREACTADTLVTTTAASAAFLAPTLVRA